MRHSMRNGVSAWVLVAGVLFGAKTGWARGPSIHARMYKAAQAMELKPQPRRPDWADVDTPPLFTFVWVSDFHLDGSRLDLLKRAFRCVDGELKPHFVMITGDNNAHAPEFKHKGRVPPVTLRRQLFLKRFLREHLETPYVIIPGDDWPQDFEKVFGAFQFSFDYGGMHFLFTTLDRCAYGVEGRAVFDESTWTWMRDDLDRNKDRPTLFMMHETLLPPAFLDAVKTGRMLEAHPNVIASFCGHLHVDVQFEAGRIKYLVCPGLGPNPRHGMKHVKVYRHALILQTLEYNEAARRYEKVMKWQKINVPPSLQASLHKPSGARFKKDNYREIPPHPRRSDPALMRRSMELVGPLMAFLGKFMTGGQ